MKNPNVMDKVLFVLENHIEWIQKSGMRGMHCGLVFEYDKNTSMDSVVSVITFNELQDSTLLVSVLNEKSKKETAVLKIKNFQNANAKEISILLFESLCKLDKKVALGKLFLIDKVEMYQKHIGKPISDESKFLQIEKEVEDYLRNNLEINKRINKKP